MHFTKLTRTNQLIAPGARLECDTTTVRTNRQTSPAQMSKPRSQRRASTIQAKKQAAPTQMSERHPKSQARTAQNEQAPIHTHSQRRLLRLTTHDSKPGGHVAGSRASPSAHGRRPPHYRPHQHLHMDDLGTGSVSYQRRATTKNMHTPRSDQQDTGLGSAPQGRLRCAGGQQASRTIKRSCIAPDMTDGRPAQTTKEATPACRLRRRRCLHQSLRAPFSSTQSRSKTLLRPFSL